MIMSFSSCIHHPDWFTESIHQQRAGDRSEGWHVEASSFHRVL